MDDATSQAPLDAAVVREWLWAFVNQTQEHAVLLLDPAGIIRWANPGAAAILNAPDMIGRPVDCFFTSEDIRLGVPKLETDVATSRGYADDDRWMRREDGSPFWANGVTVALRDASGGLFGFLKLFRNRTVQKMRLQSLENRIHDQTARVEHAKTSVAMVAHELRTPLSTLQNSLALLRLLPEENPRRDDLLTRLDSNLALCVRMVEDLTDVTRAQAGKLRIAYEEVSVGALLRSAIDAALARSGNPDRVIDLILPQQDVRVQGDPARLMQVFSNLIGNAIRYTPDNGRIWASAVTQHTEVVIKVEDCGIGIPRGMLRNIFELFTQGPDASAHDGLGIGLALVKQLVELHGGSVQAQSDGPGKGSQFFVRLPLPGGFRSTAAS